ncbi:universal stress protein [Pontibacter russatus]|uniref:universal stress protein n=1 Tax=Pontibacter russatus TaxID=2694929 RepID=UPI00137953E8|nr:universal stress protein [Pontibacter russatus]
MKTILVPIDYSDNSLNILTYALEIARVAGMDVIAFHAFFPIVSPPAAYDAADVVMALEEGKAKELESFAEDARQLAAQAYASQSSTITGTGTDRTIPDFNGIKISCVTRMGGAFEQIMRAIRLYKADLVVMGMQEGEALSQALLGSTTISVMQESNVPVLAVPKGAIYKGFGSVLFAADLHHVNARTDLHLLRDFMEPFQPKLQVLHLYRTEKQFEEFEAQGALEALSRNFRDVSYNVSFDLREDVAAGIQEYIKEQRADLLVLIPQKHTFFERLLGKSITGKITAYPSVPLLALPSSILLRAADAEEEALSL